MPRAMKPPQTHPEFGVLIAQRQNTASCVILAVMFGLFGLMLLGVAALVQYFGRPGGNTHWVVPFLALFGGFHLVISAWAIALVRRRYLFYELGMVRKTGRKTIAIRYTDAAQFTYGVMRMNVHGFYGGSIVTLRLKVDRRRSIKYGGRFKAVATGFIKRTYQDKDEIVTVRDIISSQMADVMFERLLAGIPIEWPGIVRSLGVKLTADGVVPNLGKHRGKVFPYSEVEAHSKGDNALALYRVGEKRPFVNLATGAKNFWPCHEVFQRMLSLSIGDAEPDKHEESEIEEASAIE